MKRTFTNHSAVDVGSVNFTMGKDRNQKATVNMHMTMGNSTTDVCMVTAPAITLWPRCTGDGNFGTMWGPTDVTKAKYTLDLNDADINGRSNDDFRMFQEKMDAIDDLLLDYVYANQLQLLGRKNLSREEVKMLQIRSIRPKYDKHTGNLNGYTLNLSSAKYAWDGMGGKYERRITVCDHKGAAIPSGAVAPGDVVAATMYANMVYTGVGGDKFGIHWSFQDVSVVCQRNNLEQTTEVVAFNNSEWDFAKPYVDQVSEIRTIPDVSAVQFCAA
jgi:hypothetical protein